MINRIISICAGWTTCISVLAMIIATFLEKKYGTEFADTYIYSSMWFEALLFIMTISCLYKCFTFKVKQQLTIFLIHLSLVIILLGSGITRYGGEQGYMHIREGEKSNTVYFNNKKEKLPFNIGLINFEIERYSGSSMPSMYKSLVRLSDADDVFIKDYLIYMNHILKHDSYRFYQSSFDEDYRGSILSVNHDPYGIFVTYLGYYLLIISLFLFMISKKSAFRKILSSPVLKRTLTIAFVCFLSLNSSFAKTNDIKKIDKEVADKFGKLWVQTGKGRIIPMNTLTLQLSQKLNSINKTHKLSPEQFILSSMAFPEQWKEKKTFRINKEMAKALVIPEGMASYKTLFKDECFYKLHTLLKTALAKSKNKNETDKKIIRLSEEMSIFSKIMNHGFLYVFPNVDNITGAWYTPYNNIKSYPKKDSTFIKNAGKLLCSYVSKGNKEQTIKLINKIEFIQKNKANNILPSDTKANFEIFYNKYVPFSFLYKAYLFIGVILIIAFILATLADKEKINIYKYSVFILLALFIIHTAFLLIRMYISGHAPMSNGYESSIFLSSLSIFGGLLMYKRSVFVLASGAILAGFCLLVAGFSWMNPEITNIVPVLKSFWLSIHVSLIMLAYAAAGMAFITALSILLMIIFSNKGSHERIMNACKKLSLINRLFLLIIIIFLSVGIIFGAIWANESWGRYWSWDPKETWALISLLIYTGILHIKKLSIIKFNTLIIIAFTSILMTYYGVNHYLGGMHAYSGGESISISVLSLSFFFFITIISITAQIRTSIINK